MKKVKINSPDQKPRILVAPLDWGLGHATRCIPVIYELLAQQAAVWLAGEGAQETLLKQEFPELPFLTLPGYRVRYGRSKAGLLTNLFLQVPRLLRSIATEQQWVKNAVQEYGFDAIIADNRFGLSHPTIPSVFMTHQLFIQSGIGKQAGRWLQKKNYRFINRFTECWVPDEPGAPGLAGELSHPQQQPTIPLHYTGVLSRLKKTGIAEKKRHLFISLSGPEPQRSLFENRIIRDISHYNGTAVIVRGLPTAARMIPSTNDIRVYNHLSAADYNIEIEKAEYVIARSGYSTVMDLAALQKKSILVPTPGQTEQEYLATHLAQQKTAYCISQKKFSLNQALEAASRFEYRLPSILPAAGLRPVITAFLQRLHDQSPDLG